MSVNKQLGDLLEQHMGPPVNIEAVIRGLGIELDKKAVLHDQISGQIERIEDGFRISANRADNYFRQRFTMAHELAHFLLHRDRIGAGLDDDRAYRSTEVGAYYNTEISSREEAEANRLAATILMPAALVRRECEYSASVDALAKRFQVSRQAMDIRLSTLGIQLPTESAA
ncbi:MAG: ImmA/IrrE family metallo-endopeptidase [Paracoccus sp. (in: a-proteobacteria)]|jgi:Zn-dependent peptidase ImmA (M78 family)|uniref:ImmA/IrrE family metallo-endopeptidase n=2 Tax=Paracoccus sp. TaxID=267 RepID=UPI0023695A84|nr:ImmA/IrrE family metallo-endopeptidase [Paracoccus sp. (in: a-proteobacteria)]